MNNSIMIKRKGQSVGKHSRNDVYIPWNGENTIVFYGDTVLEPWLD